MKYARIVDEFVREVIDLPDELAISDAYVPDIAKQFIHTDDEDVAEGWRYHNNKWMPPEPPAAPSIDDLKAAKMLAIDSKIVAVLAAGAPVSGGLHVSLDDGSRADMGAMATTAGFALNELVPWPDSYGQGWISIENVRIPLQQPSDGIALAAAVGDYYAKVRQNGRNLKDVVIAADTEDDVADVDIDAGWPIEATAG